MTDEEMAAAYRGGKTIKELAARMRWAQGKMHRHLLALGVELRAPGGKNNYLAARSERLDRNARAVAEGRVRVYTPEERAELQAKLEAMVFGGGK